MIQQIESVEANFHVLCSLALPLLSQDNLLRNAQIDVGEARACSGVSPHIPRSGENQPVHAVRSGGDQLATEQRLCAVIQYARSRANKTSVDSKGLERRPGVSHAWAIVEHGIVVIVEACRNVKRSARVEGDDTAESEIHGQVQDCGKIEPMSLMEVRRPPFAFQVVTVGRQRERTRSVVDRMGPGVPQQKLQPVGYRGSKAETETIRARAARSLKLIDIQETRVGACAGHRQGRVDVAHAVQLYPAEHRIFRREGSLASEVMLQA